MEKFYTQFYQRIRGSIYSPSSLNSYQPCYVPSVVADLSLLKLSGRENRSNDAAAEERNCSLTEKDIYTGYCFRSLFFRIRR